MSASSRDLKRWLAVASAVVDLYKPPWSQSLLSLFCQVEVGISGNHLHLGCLFFAMCKTSSARACGCMICWYPSISQDPNIPQPFLSAQLHYQLQPNLYQMPGAMLNIGPTRPIMLGVFLDPNVGHGLQICWWISLAPSLIQFLDPIASYIPPKMVKGGGCDWMFPWLKDALGYKMLVNNHPHIKS